MLGALLAVVLASSPIITSNPSASGVALTPLSVAPTSTGNAVVVQSTGRYCYNGASCTVNASYDGSAAINFLTGGQSFQISNTAAGASGTLRAGTSSANIAEFMGSVSGQPVSYGVYGGVGDANVDVQLTPKGAGKVKALNALVVEAPKRCGQLSLNTSTDTAFTALGVPAPTLLSGTAGTADTTDPAYQLLKFTTSTVSGNAVGPSGAFSPGVTQAGYLFHFSTVVRTDPSAVTSTRYIHGVGASSLDQVGTLAGVNTIRGCWFRFDAGLGDVNWQALSSDGATASVTDTTIAVAAATSYSLGIDETVAGVCDFYVNGVRKAAKSTNPPSGTTLLSPELSTTTLTTAARAGSARGYILCQNRLPRPVRRGWLAHRARPALGAEGR